MTNIHNWFMKNLSRVAGAVTGKAVNPIIGKPVQAAGDTVTSGFRNRLGSESEL